jgi:dephospho-CoA kinase
LERRGDTDLYAIGITGNFGSGKTAVVEYISKNYRVHLIEGDELGHGFLKPGKVVYKEIVKKYGKAILTVSGEIDRAKFGRYLFSRPPEMKRYNGIIHPPLIKELKKEIKKNKEKAENRILLVSAALLGEWGLLEKPERNRLFDVVFAVHTNRATALARLKRTRGLSRRECYKRWRTQLSPNQLKAKADYVIYNNGTRQQMEKKVRTILNRLPCSAVQH